MNLGAATVIAIAYLVTGVGGIIAGALFGPMFYLVAGPCLLSAFVAFWIITRRSDWLGTGRSVWTARRDWRSQRMKRESA